MENVHITSLLCALASFVFFRAMGRLSEETDPLKQVPKIKVYKVLTTIYLFAFAVYIVLYCVLISWWIGLIAAFSIWTISSYFKFLINNRYVPMLGIILNPVCLILAVVLLFR